MILLQEGQWQSLSHIALKGECCALERQTVSFRWTGGARRLSSKDDEKLAAIGKFDLFSNMANRPYSLAIANCLDFDCAVSMGGGRLVSTISCL
jgi:hypothetical protein